MPYEMADWDAKLDALYHLEEGWDCYYDCPEPTPDSIESARAWVKSLPPGLVPDRVVPDQSGGVGFCFRNGLRDAYAWFSNYGGNAAVNMDTSTRDEPVEVFRIDEDAIGKIRDHLARARPDDVPAPGWGRPLDAR